MKAREKLIKFVTENYIKDEKAKYNFIRLLEIAEIESRLQGYNNHKLIEKTFTNDKES